jgi:hypothetical protein
MVSQWNPFHALLPFGPSVTLNRTISRVDGLRRSFAIYAMWLALTPIVGQFESSAGRSSMLISMPPSVRSLSVI